MIKVFSSFMLKLKPINKELSDKLLETLNKEAIKDERRYQWILKKERFKKIIKNIFWMPLILLGVAVYIIFDYLSNIWITLWSPVIMLFALISIVLMYLACAYYFIKWIGSKIN